MIVRAEDGLGTVIKGQGFGALVGVVDLRFWAKNQTNAPPTGQHSQDNKGKNG
jgi:hypothetical protein